MAGQHPRARQLAARVMQHPARNVPLSFGSLQLDRQVSMRAVLARSLWMEGFASQAKSVAIESLNLARQDGPYAIALSLAFGACSVALWSGLDDEAEVLTRELLEKSERYTLGVWHLWGQLFDMVLARRRGDEPAEVVPTIALQADSIVTLDPMLSSDASLTRAKAGQAGWANPELLPCRGGEIAQIGARPTASSGPWSCSRRVCGRRMSVRRWAGNCGPQPPSPSCIWRKARRPERAPCSSRSMSAWSKGSARPIRCGRAICSKADRHRRSDGGEA